MTPTFIVCCTIVAFALLLLIFTLIAERKGNKRLKLQMIKMSYSQMFARLLPYLNESKKHCISALKIDCKGVYIDYIYSGKVCHRSFNLQTEGFYRLSNENIEVLSCLIEEMLPVLRNSRKYHFEIDKKPALNGEIKHIYNYCITLSYRKALEYYKENNLMVNSISRVN